MSIVHRRNNTSMCPIPESEDISGQIDRLNQVLQMAMQEIEASSSQSRVPSRVSMVPSESIYEADLNSPSYQSDEAHLPFEFEQKIEELLQTIDRNQMVIEDFISSESRRFDSDQINSKSEILKLRNEIELSLKMQKNLLIEKEKKNFEEKLIELDLLKEDYMKKKSDVVTMFERLKEKENLLDQKEKELRASRIAFDRSKMLWDKEHFMENQDDLKENVQDLDMPHIKVPSRVTTVGKNPLRASLPSMSLSSFANINSESADIKKFGAPAINFGSLEASQEELRQKEEEFMRCSKIQGHDTSKLEVQIDQLKNKVATLRGDKVMFESTKATKLMSNIMISIQKQSKKEENVSNRNELLERMKKKEVAARPQKVTELPEVFKIKQLEQKIPESSETARRFLFSDAPTPKAIRTPRTVEKDDPYKVYFENRKKMLVEKEKELKQRELLMQETWMKLPEAKELISNVNLMLAKIGNEKSVVENQRDELEKERLEFLRFKEKATAQLKKQEQKIKNIE